MVLASLALGARSADAGPVTPAEPQAAGKLIDVKDGPSRLLAGDDHFVASWDEFDARIDETSNPPAVTSFSRVKPIEPKAPPVIAAPLPPAVLSGLIGLAGVYIYKRRNRIR